MLLVDAIASTLAATLQATPQFETKIVVAQSDTGLNDGNESSTTLNCVAAAGPGKRRATVEASQDVLSAVRRKYDELTHSQKRIAEAIVEDPEFVAFATVDKLSERLSVAPSTVVRFAYKLGLNGYPDLQEQVRQIVRGHIRGKTTNGDGDEGLAEHLEPGGHAASLLHDLENLRQTIASLEGDRLDEAISILASARSVFVTGGYASGALAAYAALTLERIRGRAYLIENLGGRPVPALFSAASDDALLVIGFAPYSADTIQIIELARERGVRLIGLTDTPISPVGQRVDVVLPTRVSGMGAQNSLVAPVAVLNVLLNGTTASLGDSMERYDQLMKSMDRWGLFVLSGDDADPRAH
jgi:DNA-binding MurR/RpiR family transcriptional regulator